MSELKKFNIVIKAAIQKAQLYEKNELWHKARDEWLDIIEYCLLFADKTSNLKKSTKEMISEKAQNLMKRVDKIDEKISVESLVRLERGPLLARESRLVLDNGPEG